MSLLGKILVVIQTILALLFLGVTATLYYHQNDWREAQRRTAQQYSRIVQAKTEQVAKLTDDKASETGLKLRAQEALEKYKGEIKALEDKSIDLINNGRRLEDDLAAAKRDLASKEAKNHELTTLTQQYLARIGDLEESLGVANDNRSLAESQVARLIQQRAALEKDLKDVRIEFTKAQQKTLDQQLILDELVRQGVPIDILVGPFPPAPPMRGKVAGVDTSVQPALVLLTVGNDDGVRRGHTFTVYRGEKFVGKVVVSRVMADSAGCRVLFLAPGEAIQPGDDAATQLD